jgi:hypothetical protein
VYVSTRYLKEAVELYLEETPEVAVEIENIETVGA